MEFLLEKYSNGIRCLIVLVAVLVHVFVFVLVVVLVLVYSGHHWLK